IRGAPGAVAVCGARERNGDRDGEQHATRLIHAGVLGANRPRAHADATVAAGLAHLAGLVVEAELSRVRSTRAGVVDACRAGLAVRGEQRQATGVPFPTGPRRYARVVDVVGVVVLRDDEITLRAPAAAVERPEP